MFDMVVLPASEVLWVDVDESFSETLVVAGGEDDDSSSTSGSLISDLSSITKGSSPNLSSGNYRYSVCMCVRTCAWRGWGCLCVVCVCMCVCMHVSMFVSFFIAGVVVVMCLGNTEQFRLFLYLVELN